MGYSSVIATAVLLALLLTACGTGGDVPPTRIPTSVPPTPTLRSTPLPPVPDAPALGDPGREIEVLVALHGTNPDQDARNAAIALQDLLNDRLERTVEVELVNENQALDALCSGKPQAAWVNPFTYAMAANECGAQPVLAVARGRLPDVTIGRSADIVASAEITRLSQLSGTIFCRSDEHDLFTTWIFPSLLLRAQNVNPITDLEITLDYPDDLSLLSAIVNGTCAAGALPAGDFDDLLVDLALALSAEGQVVTLNDLGDVLHVLVPAGNTALPAAESSSTVFARNVVPHDVLVFPSEMVIPEKVREEIVEAVEDFFGDSVNGEERLVDLLDASRVFRVAASDYTNFRALVASSGWDMTFDD